MAFFFLVYPSVPLTAMHGVWGSIERANGHLPNHEQFKRSSCGTGVSRFSSAFFSRTDSKNSFSSSAREAIHLRAL